MSVAPMTVSVRPEDACACFGTGVAHYVLEGRSRGQGGGIVEVPILCSGRRKMSAPACRCDLCVKREEAAAKGAAERVEGT